MVLILATDGLWEFVTDQEAVDIASECSEPRQAVERLIHEASERWMKREQVIEASCTLERLFTGRDGCACATCSLVLFRVRTRALVHVLFFASYGVFVWVLSMKNVTNECFEVLYRTAHSYLVLLSYFRPRSVCVCAGYSSARCLDSAFSPIYQPLRIQLNHSLRLLVEDNNPIDDSICKTRGIQPKYHHILPTLSTAI